MLRYLRLYGCFLRFSFSRAMEFRVDFTFRILMDTVWYVNYLVFFEVLFLHTGSLGGWTLPQVRIFAGGLFVVDAIQMTVFSNNVWMFPLSVNRGDLDYHLLRPVAPLFMVSVKDFAANSFLNLLMAVGILWWAVASYPGALGAGRVAVFVALVVLGGVLHYVWAMIFLMPVFWTHSATGLRDVYWTIEQSAARPHRVFPTWARRVLSTALPMAVYVSIPTLTLFEPHPLPLILHCLAAFVGSFALLVVLWRRGLRAYSSASS